MKLDFPDFPDSTKAKVVELLQFTKLFFKNFSD